MNSITTTYPAFQSLPKGVKQMLVVSESLFFDEVQMFPKRDAVADQHRVGDITNVRGQRLPVAPWLIKPLHH
jgi:hypothetical protein